MWAVVLKILSVLGIILLCLLGLVLLLVLLVLWTPFCYRLEGEAHPGEEGCVPYAGKLKISWLLGIVGAGVKYPDPGLVKLRLFGIPVYKMALPGSEAAKKEAEKEAEKDAVKKADRETDKEEAYPEENIEETKEATQEATQEENDAGKEEPQTADASGEETEPSPIPGASEENPEAAPEPPFEGADDPEGEADAEHPEKEKVPFTEKISNTFHRGYDKIKLFLWDLDFWKRLWEDEKTQSFLRDGKKRIGRVLKVLIPRSVYADLTYGTGSPDTTGYIYGIYCLYARRFRRGSRVDPDFEEKMLDGRGKVRGHFFLGYIAWQGLLIWLDRRLKLLRTRIKKHKERKEELLEKRGIYG